MSDEHFIIRVMTLSNEAMESALSQLRKKRSRGAERLSAKLDKLQREYIDCLAEAVRLAEQNALK